MAPPDEGRPTVTCPVCGMTTAHPEDVREGYCAECHDWTSPPAVMRDFASDTGIETGHVARALRDLREDR